jgi:crotonobetainyl-CoA hydratase
MNKSVIVERRNKILQITLSRPPVNAIDYQTSCELFAAFKELQNNPELSVGIITAQGDKIFSAGWDLKEYAATGQQIVESGNYDLGPGGIGGLSEFWGLTKPVIAAVNGKAIGGGFEMLLAADLIVAADHAEFCLPEIKLGFLPDGGGIQRLTERLPYNVAADLMLTGRAMHSSEAQHYGLVCDVVPGSQLLTKAYELAQSIAQGAPLALQAMKEVLAATHQLSAQEAFAETRKAWKADSSLPIYHKMLHSEDYLEGSLAFSEKREPVYKGC